MSRMAQISIVSKSALAEDKRIDAEYFAPEYLELDKVLAKNECSRLDELVAVFDGNHMTIAEQYVKSGVRYLRAKDLSKYFLERDDPIYIQPSFFPLLKRSHINDNDVLLSIVGTIGSVALVKCPPKELTANCKLAILRTKEISPEYIYCFLVSKFGQYQINRMIRGAVQQGLILPDLRGIRVPSASKTLEKTVIGLVDRAYKKHREADYLYDETEQKLLKDFLLLGYNFSENELTYSSRSSEVSSSHRFDAEYFQPKFERFFNKISEISRRQSWKLITIGSASDPLRYGTSEKLAYLDDGVPFLRITDIKNFSFDQESIRYISKEEASGMKSETVQQGDLLISRSGTLGIAIPIHEGLSGAVFGSYFIRMRPKIPVNRDYLAFYLNSPLGKIQVEQVGTGAIQTNLTIPAIQNMKLVIPDVKIQKQIADMWTKSISLREESIALIKEATTLLEHEIRKGALSSKRNTLLTK